MTETVKIAGGRIGHVGKVVSGTVTVGDKAELAVDTDNRKSVCKNHSATHLLQKALQIVLGDHVEQQVLTRTAQEPVLTSATDRL